MLLSRSTSALALQAETIQVAWRGVPLASRLSQWEAVAGVPAFRDRRVDPEATLDLKAEGAAVDLLNLAVARHGYLASQTPGLVYLAPEGDAQRINTLLVINRQQAGKALPALRSRLRKRDSLSWPRYTTPRDLISAVAVSSGAPVANPERIPHDVWDAGVLPALSLADKLTLLLFGFDLTWQLSAERDAVLVGTLPNPIAIRQTYRTNAKDQDAVGSLLTEFPNAQVERKGRTVTLFATVEAHQRLHYLLGDNPNNATRGAGATEQVITLRVVRKPAGDVLRSLAYQLKLEVEIDPQHSESVRELLRKEIDLEFSRASLPDALRKIGALTGLRIESEASRLKVILDEKTP